MCRGSSSSRSDATFYAIRLHLHIALVVVAVVAIVVVAVSFVFVGFTAVLNIICAGFFNDAPTDRETCTTTQRQ